MTQTAVVTELLPDGKVQVRVSRDESCASCPSCETCSTQREIKLKAINTANAKPGDTVTLRGKGLFKVEVTEVLAEVLAEVLT